MSPAERRYAVRIVDTLMPTNPRRRRVNLWGVATLAILAASGALMIGAAAWLRGVL